MVLPRMDSNHDKQIQNLLCYRYTTGQHRRKFPYYTHMPCMALIALPRSQHSRRPPACGGYPGLVVQT